MLKFTYMHLIECDKCGRKEIATSGTQQQFAAKCRSNGWVIGKECTCPTCASIKGKQLTIYDLLEKEKKQDETN